jgi:hypothetical protein
MQTPPPLKSFFGLIQKRLLFTGHIVGMVIKEKEGGQ